MTMLTCPGWSEPAGAASSGTQAGTDAGGLRRAARWQASLAGVSAQSGRESGRLGRLAPGSVSPRAGRQAPGADRHGWLCGFGGGDSDGWSAGTTSGWLGAQDAQHPGESAEVRPCGSKDRSAGHLSGGRAGQSRNRFSQLRRPLAAAVRRGGATAGTGLTGVAVVLRLSPAPVAQTAHHQRDRALLRGSATENPTYGVLCERRKCGPHHLLHLPEIQSGMENPHPQPIYTSCLTSPQTHSGFTPPEDGGTLKPMVVAFAFGASVHGSSTSYRRTVCLLQDESVRFACEELQGNPSSGFIQASNAREEKRHN